MSYRLALRAFRGGLPGDRRRHGCDQRPGLEQRELVTESARALALLQEAGTEIILPVVINALAVPSPSIKV